MIENKNNSFSANECRSVRQSFSRTLDEVKSQIEYDDFAKTYPNGARRIDPLIDEVCFIIAEMMLLNPDSEIKIGGNMMYCALAQEVCQKITNAHVSLVVDNFNQITTIIHNKKAYLRTALYNSVFELDAHYTNLVRHDMGS